MLFKPINAFLDSSFLVTIAIPPCWYSQRVYKLNTWRPRICTFCLNKVAYFALLHIVALRIHVNMLNHTFECTSYYCCKFPILMDNPYKSIVDIPSSSPSIKKIILEFSQPPILTKTYVISIVLSIMSWLKSSNSL
jgi:hypothetical protein